MGYYSYGPGAWLTLAHGGAGALVHPGVPVAGPGTLAAARAW